MLIMWSNSNNWIKGRKEGEYFLTCFIAPGKRTAAHLPAPRTSQTRVKVSREKMIMPHGAQPNEVKCKCHLIPQDRRPPYPNFLIWNACVCSKCKINVHSKHRCNSRRNPRASLAEGRYARYAHPVFLFAWIFAIHMEGLDLKRV